MVELDVAQIGSNWGWGEDESEFDSDERGDACGAANVKKIKITAILPNPLHPPNNTPNNQSKPIVKSLFPHLL